MAEKKSDYPVTTHMLSEDTMILRGDYYYDRKVGDYTMDHHLKHYIRLGWRVVSVIMNEDHSTWAAVMETRE